MLLAFGPLLDETDLASMSHLNWMQSILIRYGKNCDNVVCFIGDKDMPDDVWFVGCALHRLALGCSRVLQAHEVLFKG